MQWWSKANALQLLPLCETCGIWYVGISCPQEHQPDGSMLDRHALAMAMDAVFEKYVRLIEVGEGDGEGAGAGAQRVIHDLPGVG